MANLRTELERLASSFVSSVLVAMQGSALSDLADQAMEVPTTAAPAPRGRGRGRARGARPAPVPAAPPVAARGRTPSGRRHRATAEEVEKQKDLALGTARQLKPGFSKGDVMAKASSKVDLGRALSLLVADGKLIKKGDRRMTRYWVK